MTTPSHDKKNNGFDFLDLLFQDGIGMIVNIKIGSGQTSFGQKEEAADDNLPPVELVNNRYNVKLKVSHTEYHKEYKQFQNNMKAIVEATDSSVLETIQKEKPAAVAIGVDVPFLIQSKIVPPQLVVQAVMAGHAPEGLLPLTEALNFVSGEENAIMFPCQMRKALRHGHLFNATSGDLLTADHVRTIEKTFEADLKKQKMVRSGKFGLSKVPG